MTADLVRVARAAWRLWVRDRAILLPLTGLFLFLPQWALLLLVAPVPRLPEASAGGGPSPAMMTEWSEAVAKWVSTNGLFYLAVAVLALFAQLSVAVLYLSGGSGTAGQALSRAGRLLLRFVLASLMVSAPVGLSGLMLLPLGGAGMLLILPPLLYVLGRTLLAAPVLAAEPRTGAARAVVRSWQLTHRRGLRLAGVVAAVFLPGQLFGTLFASAASTLSEGSAGNPVVLAALNAGAAAATWASGVALALAGVVIYRALSGPR